MNVRMIHVVFFIPQSPVYGEETVKKSHHAHFIIRQKNEKNSDPDLDLYLLFHLLLFVMILLQLAQAYGKRKKVVQKMENFITSTRALVKVSGINHWIL